MVHRVQAGVDGQHGQKQAAAAEQHRHRAGQHARLFDVVVQLRAAQRHLAFAAGVAGVAHVQVGRGFARLAGAGAQGEACQKHRAENVTAGLVRRSLHAFA